MLRHFSLKHKTNHKDADARTFAILEFLKSFAMAVFLTTFPIILYEKIGTEDYVGYYNSIIALVGLVTCILSSYIFCKYSKVIVTKITLFLSSFTLILMTLAANIWGLMFLDIPRAVCYSIATIAIALYLGDYSKDEDLALNEARYYLYANIGWFLGPLTAGVLVYYTGLESMFILCSFVFGYAMLYFTHQHLVANHPHILKNENQVHDEKISKLFSNIKEYFTDKERIKVFLIASGLNFHLTSFVYIIIVLKIMGYGMLTIGLVSALRCLPLIFLEPWIGRQAAKNGVKDYIISGFILSGLVFISFGFISNRDMLLVIFCLVNIGMAFVEPLQETYFFQVVKEERERDKFFGIYNTAEPIFHLLGPIIASIILTFTVGFDVLWLFYGIMMFVFAMISLTIKNK